MTSFIHLITSWRRVRSTFSFLPCVKMLFLRREIPRKVKKSGWKCMKKPSDGGTHRKSFHNVLELTWISRIIKCLSCDAFTVGLGIYFELFFFPMWCFIVESSRIKVWIWLVHFHFYITWYVNWWMIMSMNGRWEGSKIWVHRFGEGQKRSSRL